MPSWRDLPGPARRIGVSIGHAVDAARAADHTDFEPAVAELVALPTEQAGVVLGAVIRMLLEEQHSDGLDSDDMRAVLTSCYRNAVRWLPASSVQVEPLLAALSSALGIHEPGITYREITGPVDRSGTQWQDPALPGDELLVQRPPTPAEYARHAPLLIADLLTGSRRPLNSYLDVAFIEIARTEAMELP